jgi:hypothetical protein
MSLEGDVNQQMTEVQLQQMQAMLGGMGGGMPPSLGADGSLPNMPGMDPNMAQAYLTMFQYLTAQQNLGANMGLPPMPFPGMASPYNASPTVEPTVAVSVEGMKFQYQLTEDDLHKVFSRYGGVKTIRVDEAGAAAQITFVAFNDAQSAMNDLNGKVLNGLEGTLRISWVNGPQSALPPPYPSMPFPGMGFPPFPGAPGWPSAAPGAPAGGSPPNALGAGGYGQSSLSLDGKAPHTKGVRKYTCRFIIGIENDKEFQVARRVIGAKGANMKRIVKQTEAKLRLRGMGSGYFEGAGQKESSEPLQLCVSCTNGEHYKSAVRQVEDLLKRVYEEYKAFCRENNKPFPDLAINFSENQLVYSASRSAMGPNTLANDSDDGDGGDMSGSPKKERRSRRSRTKGGSSKMPSGDDDRGEPGPNAPPVVEIEKMIDMRNEARRACNFAEADRLREALHTQGVALMDEPGGRGRGAEVTTWRYWRD